MTTTRLALIVARGIRDALTTHGDAVTDFPALTVERIIADVTEYVEHLERPTDESGQESFWVDECLAKLTFRDLFVAMFSKPRREKRKAKKR